MAQVMQDNANQVTSLLDEIIGLSLIESTEKMRRDDNMEVNKQLRALLKEHESKAKEGVKLQYQSALSDEFTFRTNTNMLNRIIACLLDNAVKYTEKGHIILSACKAEKMLSFIVEDTGCGIPAKEAEHIFERFVKLDSFKEGIGLGLPLCRKLAEQLGGTVVFDPSYTDGARFIINLPITE